MGCYEPPPVCTSRTTTHYMSRFFSVTCMCEDRDERAGGAHIVSRIVFWRIRGKPPTSRGSYDAAAVDVEIDPQCCRFRRSQTHFQVALQAIVEPGP